MLVCLSACVCVCVWVGVLMRTAAPRFFPTYNASADMLLVLVLLFNGAVAAYSEVLQAEMVS